METKKEKRHHSAPPSDTDKVTKFHRYIKPHSLKELERLYLEAQREYQRQVQTAFGIYVIARDFTSFVSWYEETFKP